jgi:hypothetical protein
MPAPFVAWVSTPGKGTGPVTPTYGGPVAANDILLILAETWTTPTTDIFDPGNDFGGSDVIAPTVANGTKLVARWRRARW